MKAAPGIRCVRDCTDVRRDPAPEQNGATQSAATVPLCWSRSYPRARGINTRSARNSGRDHGCSGDDVGLRKYLEGIAFEQPGGYNRVSRGVALARHLREAEGLSIAQIAERLGRSPAAVKAHFYDPTGEKARAVKAR